jgi:hypothetical protein
MNRKLVHIGADKYKYCAVVIVGKGQGNFDARLRRETIT